MMSDKFKSLNIDKLEFPKILEYIKKYIYTEFGKILVSNIKPFESVSEVTKVGQLVNEAKEVLIHNDKPPIEYLFDLRNVLYKSRIENSILDVNDVFSVLSLVKMSRKVFVFLKNNDKSITISELFGNKLFIDKNFENSIGSIFTDTGEVRDSASTKLREIRKEIQSKNEYLRKAVNRIMKKLSESYLVQEEYITQRDGRIVIPVKSEHKRHVKGFIHSESSSGQTVYIEPEETLELNNEILSLSFEEKREIERILKSITKRVGSFANELLSTHQAISELDVIFAKANYAIEIIGSFPSIDSNKPFELINARHPILLKKLTREAVVPLNVKIDKDLIILITGPNAGGKTVVLKTIGILIYMVMSGIPIPADPDSNIYHISKILIDIGDEQSIEDDLSTFSSHLKNIKEIINNADSNSIVLLDELGTGTDPSEGSAIASAVLLELKKKKSMTFASTHHGNLKILAEDTDGFQNSSMEFDAVNLIPTYKFKQDVAGSSYAFEVASRIGFDPNFTELAKQYLDSDKVKLENFLTKIEEKSFQLQKKLDESKNENIRYKGLANLYAKKVEELTISKNKILKEAKIKADNYLDSINKKFENTIKNIRESNASKEVIKESMIEISKMREEHSNIFESSSQNSHSGEESELKVGDYAQIKDTSTIGEILKIDENKNRAVIVSKNIKLQVKLDSLIKTKKIKTKNKSIQFHEAELKSLTLDIRGQKPEEAEFEIIKFLDSAMSRSESRIEIIHGKGTGVLKKMVHKILNQQSYVKKYYFAKIEHGGEGITIIEL